MSMKLLLVFLFTAVSGCSMAGSMSVLGRGEWFGVQTPANSREIRFSEVRLISSDGHVDIKKFGEGRNYDTEYNIKVPENFTLRWRAEGETTLHEAAFRVRSQLPKEVIRLLKLRSRPVHVLSLNFRVVSGKAECLWSLRRLDGGGSRGYGSGGATILDKGIILPN